MDDVMVNYYEHEKISSRITLLRSLTGELLYLVEGEERAALIDTGTGIGGLKDLVNSLTDKPVLVLLTHGHVDHAMGAPEFEKVYMNPADIPVYQRMSPLSERQGYIQGGLDPKLFAQIKETDYVPPVPEQKFMALEEGMAFDLGGVHIDAYAYPGHTRGSMVFLIREERVLILGDACNDATFLFSKEAATVREYQATTRLVKEKTEGKFDRVFLSHQRVETGADIMDNMIALCDEIYAGTTDDVPFAFKGMHACIAKKCTEQFVRVDGKSGNLIYNKERIE